jgi:hypothetical protein
LIFNHGKLDTLPKSAILPNSMYGPYITGFLVLSKVEIHSSYQQFIGNEKKQGIFTLLGISTAFI